MLGSEWCQLSTTERTVTERYSELEKEVKRNTKTNKRAFIENLADETETAAQTQNVATLYKITNTLIGG